MEPVHIIAGRGVPLNRSDVDTDQIIPSDWLKRVERTGFEKGLFSEWRDDRDFVLNREEHQGANILVAGPNFGTGSSREHAVWAIQQHGFEAVVSPRFGDIFFNNSTKNGLVPVQVSAEVGQQLLDAITADPDLEIVIDVELRTIEVQGIDLVESFPLDDIRPAQVPPGPRRHRPHAPARGRDHGLRGPATRLDAHLRLTLQSPRAIASGSNAGPGRAPRRRVGAFVRPAVSSDLGRNVTLIRGPPSRALGTQCSNRCCEAPPMTNRSPPAGVNVVLGPPPLGRIMKRRVAPSDTIATGGSF